jgi:peptide/nickel transport system permease protein
MAVQLLIRLAWLVVSLIVASVLVFTVVNVLPGDVAAIILGTSATPEALDTLRHQLGLDQPAWLRYLQWVGGILHGDFGQSLLSHSQVGPLIIEKLSVSGPLALASAAISIIAAVPLGVLSGTRYRSATGAMISAISLLGIAVPAFWAGLLLATVFAIQLHAFPAGGFTDWSADPLAAVRSLVLPALALGLVQAAVLTRYIRSAIIEVQREDFIRTARAKGLPRRTVVFKHGLRAALTPIVTIFGIDLGTLIGSTVITETVFNLHGLGLLLITGIRQQDLPIILGVTILAAVALVVANLIVDILYAVVDPRVSYS